MTTFKQVLPSPQERSTGKNTCEYIVLHHTGTAEGTIKGVIDGLYRRADYASCHYCVDTNGDIYKIGIDSDILWHAGESAWKGRTDMNKYSIGIEVIGPMSNGGFTDEQRNSVAELIKELCQSHKIPLENVIRHKDIAPKRKVDIADSFWNGAAKSWEEWKSTINTPKIPEVSPEAKEAWSKAIEFGMISDKSNPQDIPNNTQFQHLFANAKVMQKPKDDQKQLQWFIIALERLGVFDKSLNK